MTLNVAVALSEGSVTVPLYTLPSLSDVRSEMVDFGPRQGRTRDFTAGLGVFPAVYHFRNRIDALVHEHALLVSQL